MYNPFFRLYLVGCKQNSKTEKDNTSPITTTKEDSSIVNKELENTVELGVEKEKQISIKLKQETLVKANDDKDDLKDLVIEKSYQRKEKDYILDFKYPLLNEGLKKSHANFNEYITEDYVDISGTVKDIKDTRLVFCNTIEGLNSRDKRQISYKIYNLNKELISVLFYKENFYSGAMHPSYTFDCINFNLNKGVFMTYEDFFVKGSEDEFIEILNNAVKANVTKEKTYADCWQISEDDFLKYKNNFVINDDVIEYYFDDCVVCPSYTGSYSIKIDLKEITPFIKKHNFNPLL